MTTSNTGTAGRTAVEKGHGRAASRTRARILTYAGLVIASALAVFPLLFMVFSSLKADDQIFADLGGLRAFLPVGRLSLENTGRTGAQRGGPGRRRSRSRARR